MDVNFFSWLRNGVKQSVLLGVSDAIEDLGMPENSDELHPGVAAFLRGETNSDGKRLPRSKQQPARKRLGKSLKEIEASTQT